MAPRCLPKRPAIAATLLLAALATGCSRESLVAKRSPVFLISVDTLRADRLPAYGYKAVETPHLDALAKDSVLFENAYSQVPLTLPSHASLMTGHVPAVHGVRDNVGYRLKPDLPTLAELLKENGYATGGAVSTIVLAGESGMRDGFDFYEDSVEADAPNLSLGRVQRDGAETGRLLTRWISQVPKEKIPFAFLHVYEPHTPYEPPEPYKSRYASSPYDGEIARADEIVGDFLDFLRKEGLYDRSLIVFLSDHGEGLGDHGEDEHGIFLYRESIHVPLLIKFPGSARAGARVVRAVGLLDVTPTVLATLGLSDAIPKTAPALDGVSLLDLCDGRPAPEARRIFAETVFPRLHYGWSDLAALVDDRFHYIEAPRPELYDNVQDPRQRTNLAPSLPPAFRSMRLEMGKRRAATIEAPKADPEQAARLASLGYIGSTAASPDAKDLADPKDKTESVRRMKLAFEAMRSGNPDDAVGLFQDLLKLEPKMADVWNGLAQAYRKSGRRAESLTALKETAKLSPAGSTEHFLSIAALALELEDFKDAQVHAELALQGGNSLAHETLASIAIERKDFTTAAREIDEAQKKNPGRRFPHLVRGRLLAKQGKYQEALAELDRLLALTAEKNQKTLMTVHQLRGDVLGRLGRDAEAEAAFEEEIRRFPDNLEVFQNLALLYASQGRVPLFFRTIDRLLSAFPNQRGFLSAIRLLDVVGDHKGALATRAAAAAKFPADPRFRGPADGRPPEHTNKRRTT